MRLTDALTTAPGRHEIPDCWRSDLPQLLADMGLMTGVEIGVEQGLFSEELCKAGLIVYSVDPWIHCPAWSYQREQRKMEDLYEQTKARLASYPNSHIVRKTSMDALADFPDGSLDWVYIDGNHEFRYIAEDLYEWPRKVRKGGIVAGHDYFTPVDKRICAVAPIVHAYVAWFNVETWYVLGSKRRRPGEKRERHRSWLWFKQE